MVFLRYRNTVTMMKCRIIMVKEGFKFKVECFLQFENAFFLPSVDFSETLASRPMMIKVDGVIVSSMLCINKEISSRYSLS